MPIEFDPAWEYWEPNPEIAYAMSVPMTNRDLVKDIFADVRRDGFTLGMRFGRGNPNFSPTHLAPNRTTKVRERARWTENRYCVQCKQCFTPKYRKQAYCTRKCALSVGGLGAERTLPDVVCGMCKKVFRPAASIRRFCSRACFGKEYQTRQETQENKLINNIDKDEFVKMFMDGISVQEICKRFNVTRPTIKRWRRQLKISPRTITGRPGEVSFESIDKGLFSKMYLDGRSTKYLMEAFGVTKDIVQRWRRRLKLPARASGRPKRAG